MSRTEKLAFLLARVGHACHFGSEGRSSQKRILHMLRQSGGMTQRELTEKLGIQPGSASEIIKKLENAGLISRTRNETDHRTVDIRLTEAGMTDAEACQPQEGSLFSVLSEDEQVQLLALLEKLAAGCQAPDREHHHHGGRHRKFHHHG